VRDRDHRAAGPLGERGEDVRLAAQRRRGDRGGAEAKPRAVEGDHPVPVAQQVDAGPPVEPGAAEAGAQQQRRGVRRALLHDVDLLAADVHDLARGGAAAVHGAAVVRRAIVVQGAAVVQGAVVVQGAAVVQGAIIVGGAVVVSGAVVVHGAAVAHRCVFSRSGGEAGTRPAFRRSA
jgi:hypothetical protein